MVTLFQRKETLLVVGYNAGRFQMKILRLWRRENSLFLKGIKRRHSDCPAGSIVTVLIEIRGKFRKKKTEVSENVVHLMLTKL
jgi:hypothetical protein